MSLITFSQNKKNGKIIIKQAGTCISCEDLSVYKSDKKLSKNKLNAILLWVRIYIYLIYAFDKPEGY